MDLIKSRVSHQINKEKSIAFEVLLGVVNFLTWMKNLMIKFEEDLHRFPAHLIFLMNSSPISVFGEHRFSPFLFKPDVSFHIFVEKTKPRRKFNTTPEFLIY